MKPYILWTFPALMLTLSASLNAADEVATMAMSDDYRMEELQRMPCAESPPGLRFEKRDYAAYRATEWQARIDCPAVGEVPLYEDIESADFIVRFPSGGEVTLHWSSGSHASITDFQPHSQTLDPAKSLTLESFGGRSSDGVMPYFNLASEDGGLVLAIGWSGDWKVSIQALPEGRVRIAAGLKHSRFRLRPGEQVKLPSVLVMSYCGDWVAGQNQFRRLMLKHFTPHNHPPMELMPVAASVHGMLGFNETTEDKLAALAADIAALKLPLDTYWLDAGWNEGGFPLGQGNPQADAVRFPRGLAPVGEAVGKTSLRFLVWFEPERAMKGTWLEREHAEWLLAPSGTPEALRYMENDGFRLVDLGNAQARAWLLDNLSTNIRDAGIAVYRQDFNEYPAFFWHTTEPPDQTGLREVRYVTGLYEFLDELARRHPGLIIDNCASGGRRLDFEMMRRCVALWRSDSCWDDKSFPRNVQAMTHGLSHWLPLHGLGAAAVDDIALRSGMGACASFAINFRDPHAVAALRRHLDLFLKVRRLFTADFYPLTEWNDDPTKWLAFQFHDPEKQEGLVQAFCRGDAAQRAIRLRLKGLEPDRHYTVMDWDQPSAPTDLTGADLASGIELSATNNQQAIVLQYASQ